MAFANLENCEINLALAEKVLKDIISPDEEMRVVTLKSLSVRLLNTLIYPPVI